MDILYLSPADWFGPRGRFQHLAERLSQHNRVLYTEGLGVRKIRISDCRRVVTKLKESFHTPQHSLELNSNLYRVTPLALPSQGNTLLKTFNQSLLRTFIVRQLKRRKMHVPLVWISYPHPDLVAILDRFPHGPVIYDYVDRWDQFHQSYANLRQSEERLFRRADMVLATAESLQERAARFSSKTFLVPNGVDVAGYMRALQEQPQLPQDIASIPYPRIGFVGNIADWVDMDLVEELARQRPDWHFVLIGPWQLLTPPPAYPNIHWLGARPYTLIPHYVAAFDVCLIPFKDSELTRAVDPLKLYEYLAVGRPVVTTPLPRAEGFRDLIRIASGVSEHLWAIQDALHEDSSLAIARKTAVQPHSWERRMETVAALAWENLGIDLAPQPRTYAPRQAAL